MCKSIKSCYYDKLNFSSLMDAYNRAIKGKMNKNLVYYFNLERNIINIYNELYNLSYKCGKYNTFTIYEPKERVIKALPFKDRVVQQWYIYEFIKPFIVDRFIYDSYACIEGKGTHKAVDRLQSFMKKMYRKNNNYYVLKCDIKKFFNNIDKDILFHIMKKYISDKEVIWLTSLFVYDGEYKGLTIGNYTSQNFTNIYLNELDYFVKYILKIKYYIRYMDDFILLLDTKEECRFIKNKIEVFLKDKLNLELNNRSIYFPNYLSIDFCGYRIFNNYRLVRKKIKKKINTSINKWERLFLNDSLDIDKVYLSINSYYGYLKHCNSYRYRSIINNKINDILTMA